MKDILQGFKNFIMRGNVIELAVAFVLGTAFVRVVTAIVEGLLTPLIAALFGEPNLGGVLAFSINNAQFYPGAVLNALITFLLTAAAIYFLVVLPINKLSERRKRGQVEEPEATAEDILLLQEIRDLLKNRPTA